MELVRWMLSFEYIPNPSLKSWYYRINKSDFGVLQCQGNSECGNNRGLRFVSVFKIWVEEEEVDKRRGGIFFQNVVSVLKT